MKIAFMVGSFPTLSETFILSQITGLLDREHEVDIYATRPIAPQPVHEDVTEYRLIEKTCYRQPLCRNKVIRLIRGVGQIASLAPHSLSVLVNTLNPFRYGRAALSLQLLNLAANEYRDRPNYDIIHCHFGPAGRHAVMAREAGLISGKILTTFHGYDVNKLPRIKPSYFYASLFGKGDLFTANTTFTRDQAVALGCPGDRVQILPVGLDTASPRFAFQPRAQPGTGRPVRVVTVARLVEKKGLEYSIRAFAKVAEKHGRVEYLIAGEGALRGSLEALIAELGMEERITLVGWQTQDQISRLYEGAHIFVLSSVTASDGDKEGQGLVLQEAQAMGLPVLSTLHNGIPDGVLDGVSGYLVPERDVDALAERLEYLIEHPERWPEMGRAGRRYVEEHYDINKLNDRLVEIYQGLLNKPVPRSDPENESPLVTANPTR